MHILEHFNPNLLIKTRLVARRKCRYQIRLQRLIRAVVSFLSPKNRQKLKRINCMENN